MSCRGRRVSVRERKDIQFGGLFIYIYIYFIENHEGVWVGERVANR